MQCSIYKHFDYLTPLSEAENDEELAKIARLKYAKACANLNTDAIFFADTVDEIRKYSAWRVVGCKSLEEFCETKLGRTLEAVEQLISGVRSLQAVGVTKPTAAEALAAAPKLAGHGEIGNGRSRRSVRTSTRGETSSYLAARLKRDHPAIAARVEAGEFKSIRAAAIEAGIVKVPTALDQLRFFWGKATDSERRQFIEEMTDAPASGRA